MRCKFPNMGTRAVEQGPTGERLAQNVARLREARGISLRTLSERLSELGRPILPSGLSKIEQGDRRVDVDDLVALAVALNVSPGWLLLPDRADDSPVRFLEAVEVPAWAAWQWVDGQYPLPSMSANDGFNTSEEHSRFRSGRPAELRHTEDHPAVLAARSLYFRVMRTAQRRGDAFRNSLQLARQDVVGVSAALDELEDEVEHGTRRPEPKFAPPPEAVEVHYGEGQGN